MEMLIPLLTTIGRGVIERYVTADKAKQLSMFAFDILERGVGINSKLGFYHNYVSENLKKAAAEGTVWQPSKEDFQNVWQSIHSRDEVFEAAEAKLSN